MVIWLSALPLGLYESCGWATIPLALVIGFLLLGIDEIGVQIEEPFGLMPLDEMCAEIQGDLFSILKEAVVTKKTAVAAAAAALSQSSLPLGELRTSNAAPFNQVPFSPKLPDGQLAAAYSEYQWDGKAWDASSERIKDTKKGQNGR